MRAMIDITRIKRILVISTKPTKEEFFTVAKITAISMILIGLIGIIIYFVFSYVR